MKTLIKKEKIEARGSSLFSELNFDNSKLIVDMINGGMYEYTIPESVWQQFKQAASKGSFYNTYIKNVYQYKRLR